MALDVRNCLIIAIIFVKVFFLWLTLKNALAKNGLAEILYHLKKTIWNIIIILVTLNL